MEQHEAATRVAEPGVGEYRAVSGLAIAALILGILSVSALVYPLFWSVPVVGVLCALLALRVVRVRSDELSGRTIAIIGLMLSLVFLSWSVTHHLVRRYSLVEHAKPFAMDWLERVQQGHLEEAHEMFLEPSQRRPPGMDLKRFYAEHDRANRDLENLFLNPCLKPIVRHGMDGRISFERVIAITRSDGIDYVTLQYAYRYKEDGKDRETAMHLLLVRYYDASEGIAMWSLDEVYQVDAAPRSGITRARQDTGVTAAVVPTKSLPFWREI